MQVLKPLIRQWANQWCVLVWLILAIYFSFRSYVENNEQWTMKDWMSNWILKWHNERKLLDMPWNESCPIYSPFCWHDGISHSSQLDKQSSASRTHSLPSPSSALAKCNFHCLCWPAKHGQIDSSASGIENRRAGLVSFLVFRQEDNSGYLDTKRRDLTDVRIGYTDKLSGFISCFADVCLMSFVVHGFLVCTILLSKLGKPRVDSWGL